MLKYKRGKKIATVLDTRRAVSTYRQAPGDFEAAAKAAVHYAKRHGKAMLIVPGNSYGHAVFHIVDPQDKTKDWQAYLRPRQAAVAGEDGVVHYATPR